MKKIFTGLLFSVATLALVGCETDANVASRNLSVAAGQFEINRRIVFYNGITDNYMLVIEGKCSLDISPSTLRVTCKTGDGPKAFKRHYLGLSDNVTYFAEQIESATVSTYHYRVVFKPQSIIPDIDFEGDLGELVNPSNNN